MHVRGHVRASFTVEGRAAFMATAVEADMHWNDKN